METGLGKGYEEFERIAPPRYEFRLPSVDDLRKIFERGGTLESPTHSQMVWSPRLYYRACARLRQACRTILKKENLMQSHNPKLPAVVAYLALDWTNEHHEGRLQAEGSSRVESLVIPQRPEAVQDWLSQLRARFPLGSVAVALEQSRRAPIYSLMSYDFFLLYPVPPKTLADIARPSAPVGPRVILGTRSAAGPPASPSRTPASQ